jgi:hypothetical protein
MRKREHKKIRSQPKKAEDMGGQSVNGVEVNLFDAAGRVVPFKDLAAISAAMSKQYSKHRSETLGTSKSSSVSKPSEILIDFLIPADRAEDMLLEMEKAFEKRWLPKYGARRARQIYLLQSTGAVVGYWLNWIKQYLDVFKLFAS